MTTASTAMSQPPVRCTPCRVTVDGNRYRVYEDGSVSTALTTQEIARLGYTTWGQVREHEAKLARLDPHSLEAKTIRREAARQRRNRNAREKAQAMRDMGMTKTSYGWE